MSKMRWPCIGLRLGRDVSGPNPKSKMRLPAWRLGSLGVAAALFAHPALAQSGSLLPQDGSQATTILAQSAQAIGVRRCYSAVDQVSRRTFDRVEHADVVLDWDRAKPDDEPLFSLSGLQYANGTALLSLTTAPSSGGGCSILAERISSAPHGCKEVAQHELSGFRSTSLVKGVTVYTAPGRPRESVTLVDAQSSCVMIRRQVAFHWGGTQ